MTLIMMVNCNNYRTGETPPSRLGGDEPGGFHSYLNQPLKVRLARYHLSKAIADDWRNDNGV